MNDIKMMNVEMNPVKYHIAIKNMERKIRSEKMQPTPDLIIPEESKHVSCQPLPMFWNANPCKKSSVMRSESCIQVETGDIDSSQRLY
ncbi:hypothetical protein TVAG_147860 [Trichomonas vaginalis G3]|uniref:Uncharacterized protein n=1 Tax=Trichomonas vaginalis (strain ATCC PRA-98 / G3) TaxID=412133 RepID=A2FVD6_TRIV3|nr:hypothetical protein TVAGG3_0403580 [Trichomonas vaginalis G3]EAX91139.1 hypothetical protein TVAG_147860 [Trichomonas vaginalis G3]KAI5534874.1 hypothetical protein TVAGG3_0403580 [Trichomonas vaginalis G3]|eukprot:XP_001304069.1 hypothetical protein [Trichomonas vaginalis G3]